MKIDREVLLQCLRRLVRPVARFCMKHSIKVQDLVECMKIELIEAAQFELDRQASKATQSRLSILTGLRRREVQRLWDGETKLGTSPNLISKVVSLWQEGNKFSTAQGLPRVLSWGRDGSEFNELVRSVSNDLNPATVLFELKRVGAVEERQRGVGLVVHNYVPKGDVIAGFEILSQDCLGLIDSVQENVLERQAIPNHHLRTEYDKVRRSDVGALRAWFLKEGHALHLRARKEIAKHDQEVSPDPHYTGDTVRVAFTSFSFVGDDVR